MYDAHRAEIKESPRNGRFLRGDDDARRIVTLLADDSEQRGSEFLCGGNGCVKVFVGFVERDDEACRDSLFLDGFLVPLQNDGETNVKHRARCAGVHEVTGEIDDGEGTLLDCDAVA